MKIKINESQLDTLMKNKVVMEQEEMQALPPAEGEYEGETAEPEEDKTTDAVQMAANAYRKAKETGVDAEGIETFLSALKSELMGSESEGEEQPSEEPADSFSPAPGEEPINESIVKIKSQFKRFI
jgi:hypothetical protein